MSSNYASSGAIITKPFNITQVRGIGTDVGIVSSIVFLAQFILSLTMGTIIEFAGE